MWGQFRVVTYLSFFVKINVRQTKHPRAPPPPPPLGSKLFHGAPEMFIVLFLHTVFSKCFFCIQFSTSRMNIQLEKLNKELQDCGNSILNVERSQLPRELQCTLKDIPDEYSQTKTKCHPLQRFSHTQ